LKLTEHQIEQTYKVNILAHFWTLREFLPSMMKRNRGHIVTTASVLGKHFDDQVTYFHWWNWQNVC